MLCWEHPAAFPFAKYSRMPGSCCPKAQLAAEAEALRKRVAQGRAEQNRARQGALEMVLPRYNNVKKDMARSARNGIAME